LILAEMPEIHAIRTIHSVQSAKPDVFTRTFGRGFAARKTQNAMRVAALGCDGELMVFPAFRLTIPHNRANRVTL